MVKGEKIKASYFEYQASLFGATFAALGVGVLFSEYLKSIYLFLIFLGLLLHGWGMYKINSRNNEDNRK